MNEHLVNETNDVRQRCPSHDELAAFVSGRVDERGSVLIAEHVGRCRDCQIALESHDSPLLGLLPQASEFENEPEARRMIAAAKALKGDARRPAVPAESLSESISTKSELDATEGFSDSASKTRTYQPVIPEGLGRYHIDAILGEGAFGRVFRAHDTELGRQVAIKLSHPELEATFQQSLVDEARSAAQLRHPGIVSIYDVGRATDGATFVVMEYVDGQSLRDLLARERPSFERPSVERAVEIIVQIAKAVHYAHKRGLVHRDLKPGNVLIDRGGEVRVADFGLALAEDQQRSRAGEFAGTPAYMSPEQVRSESHRLDGRTDIWALGVILYEMLTGRRPFHGKRDTLLDEIEHRPPKPPRQYDDRIPLEVERICLKCLEKHPERRYSTSLDLASDLERWRVSRRDKKRHWPLIASAAACVIALVGGIRYFVKSSGLPSTSTVGASSASRLNIDSLENRFVWQRLLDHSPKPLFAPTMALERWHYDALRKDVEVTSPGYFFLELGETQLSTFRVKVTMGKTAATGAAGVFLGYQPAATRNGRATWKCQMVTLAVASNKTLRIDRDDMDFEEVPNDYMPHLRKYKWIVVPKQRSHSTTMTLSVVLNRLQEIHWQGEKFDSINDPQDGPPHGAVRGKFGLVNLGGTTVFSDVEFQSGGP